MAFDRVALREHYPFESHWLDRGGVRYHYLDEGSGPPVVMVHGNPTWSFYWRELVKELRRDHRVIVPDHVGCGLSDKPGDDAYRYVLESRVADLEALLEHLGLKQEVTLVVHDWGGMIGFGWATRHPERVARLVVLNTAAFRLPPAKPLPIGLRVARDLRGVNALLVRGLNLFVRSALWVCPKRPLPPGVGAGLAAPYDSWANRIAIHRFVQDIPLRPGDPSWEAIVAVEQRLEKLAHVPMLVGWGKRDFVFDDHFLAEWRRRFPDAEVKEFPYAGHYVVEDARDELVPLVRSFVTRPAGRAAAVAGSVA